MNPSIHADDPTDNAPIRRVTLLTVDDEPSVLSSLKRLFRMHGFDTVQADSGAKGLALLQEHDVDLVISDMRMPEMDGAKFLELVRERRPDVARILLTGYADIGATIRAINQGEVFRYVAKPWNDEELLLTVRDALARRDLERKNAELMALTRVQNEQLVDANRNLESRVAARTTELQQVNGMLESAYTELERTLTLTVNVFTNLLELREGVPGHARRVGDLARNTAQALGLSARDVRDIHLAGLLHDVGKISFPDYMIGKAVSVYSPEETARYRHHPTDGEALLMPLVQLQGVAHIVRQHHERVDGKGFPDGLSGPQITTGAKIISAVSDYDGLIQGMQAQSRYSPERAQQLLRGGIGTRYDGDVVEALLTVVLQQAAREARDRLIDVRELRPEMVLSRDLISPSGAILLAAGFKFDQRLIDRVCEFARREKLRLTLYVLKEGAQL